MNNAQKERLELLANATRTQYPMRLKNNFEFMTPLQNAITSRMTVEIEYKNNKDEKSRRLLEPIGMVFYAFAWHLIAWCNLRKDYRDFKIERIVSVKETVIPFKKAHIPLQDYIKNLPVAY